MRRIIVVLSLLLCSLASSLAGEHRIVIVSLDGCRWDYPQMYHTPFLDKLGHDGVQAVMQPSFPSSTFPNHYTLATGLVPDHHGIIANVFYHKATNTTFALGKNQNDPAYWGGDRYGSPQNGRASAWAWSTGLVPTWLSRANIPTTGTAMPRSRC